VTKNMARSFYFIQRLNLGQAARKQFEAQIGIINLDTIYLIMSFTATFRTIYLDIDNQFFVTIHDSNSSIIPELSYFD